jgi:hypothetical protein
MGVRQQPQGNDGAVPAAARFRSVSRRGGARPRVANQLAWNSATSVHRSRSRWLRTSGRPAAARSATVPPRRTPSSSRPRLPRTACRCGLRRGQARTGDPGLLEASSTTTPSRLSMPSASGLVHNDHAPSQQHVVERSIIGGRDRLRDHAAVKRLTPALTTGVRLTTTAKPSTSSTHRWRASVQMNCSCARNGIASTARHTYANS